VLALGLYLVAMTPLAGPLTLAPGTAQAAMAKHGLYGFTALLLLLPGFMGIGALGARAARGSWWGRLLTNPVAVYLGTISYGVFLWHSVLLELIQDQLDLPDFQGGFWLLLVLVILASVGFATVSWFAIESPCRRWAHRVSSLATRG
jgi:peptidoglycan/LPS O-acetylase OafA/YrhL